MKKNKLLKQVGLFLLILLAVSAIASLFSNTPQEEGELISLNQLVQQIKNEQVKEIVVQGEELTIYSPGGEAKISRKEEQTALSTTLANYGLSPEELQGVNIQIKPVESNSWPELLTTFGIIFLPLILFGVFFWFILRQTKGGMNQTMSFLKSPDQRFQPEKKHPIGFQDIGNLTEAKNELEEIVDFLKRPGKYLEMGAKIPRGVLLVGPPGTGKTLLARAVAHQANVPFYSISGSEFVEMFVGVGSRRVKSLFAKAKQTQPSIIFIDELDAIGRRRGSGHGGGHDEREQTLNQILVEMDGFKRESKVILLAATNRPDTLDPALLRPGRFDRRIVTDIPDIKGREEILKIHNKNKPLEKQVDLEEIAKRTAGFSGADLENVANEAAILATRRHKKNISQEDLMESIEKVLLGPERKSHILNKEEKKITAYHEAGHALVSAFLPDAETVRKVSIVARGVSAGYTITSPQKERRLATYSQLIAKLAVLLGGYSAEKLKFKEVTTGAVNDLQRASNLAQRLVEEYGMSALGPISFGEQKEVTDSFYSFPRHSEKIRAEIDQETKKLIKQAEKTAGQVLSKHQKILAQLANLLVEKETIEKTAFEKIVPNNKKKGKE
jgi:cell division protease FtsH